MSQPREQSDQLAGVRLASLLDALHHGVLILDERSRVRHANRGFVDLVGLGVAPDALLGTPLPAGPASYPHAYPDPATARDRMAAALAGGRPVRDARYPMTGGRTVAHDYTPVTAGGTTAGHLWVLRDVTEQPPDHPDQGRAAAARRRGEFAAAIAHELRSPATSIAAFAELLGDAGLDPDGRLDAAGTVRRNAERLLALARDTVLLADLDAAVAATAGPATGSPEATTPVDLPDLARRVTDGTTSVDLPDLVGRVAAGLRPPVPVVVTAGPPVAGDPALLRQGVAAAIATVAAVAAPGGGGARVRVRAEPTGWAMVVTAGVDAPVTTERLLAVRVPGDGETGAARNGALSLLLARAVAELHGGGLHPDHDPTGANAPDESAADGAPGKPAIDGAPDKPATDGAPGGGYTVTLRLPAR